MKAAAIASHRFGFSEPSLSALQSDPRGWVLEQFKQPAAMDTGGLIDSVAALQLTREVLKTALAAKPARARALRVASTAPVSASV